MQPKRHRVDLANESSDDVGLTPQSAQEVSLIPKKRGRPPGTGKNQKKREAARLSLLSDDTQSGKGDGLDKVMSKSTRKNPGRLLKGKGGDLAQKQSISKAIDPKELKVQASILAAAKSPIPTSTPLNPIAPASLQPSRKKAKTTSSKSVPTVNARILPVLGSSSVSTSSEATLSHAPKSFPDNTAVSNSQGIAVQGYKYPAYSLATSDSAAMTTAGGPTEHDVHTPSGFPGTQVGGGHIAPAFAASQGPASSGFPGTQAGGRIAPAFAASRGSMSSGFPGTQAGGHIAPAFAASQGTQAGGHIASAFAANQTAGPMSSAFASTGPGEMVQSGLTGMTEAGTPMLSGFATTADLNTDDSQLRYGFQPPAAPHKEPPCSLQLSEESTARENVGIGKEFVDETSQATNPETDPLSFPFSADLDGMTFSDEVPEFSFTEDDLNSLVRSNEGLFLPGGSLVWPEGPMDAVYGEPNSNATSYIASTNSFSRSEEKQSEKTLQPVIVSGAVEHLNEELELTNRLQKELFEVGDEDMEVKSNRGSNSESVDEKGENVSESESESDTSESEDEKVHKRHSRFSKVSSQPQVYVAPARPPRSQPYSGSLLDASTGGATVQIAQSDLKPTFIGNSHISSQPLKPFSVAANLKKTRKSRSDVTAALRHFGTTQLLSHSPSPAPSNLSSGAGFHTMLATPEPTPGPLVFSEDQNDADEILCNEDRAFYTGVYLVLYDRSRDISRYRLFTENAFPECPNLFKEEKQVKLQDVLIECVDQAIEELGLQNDEFVQKNKYGIALGISKDRSTFRGDVKTYARKVVATILSIRKELQKKTGKNSIGEDMPFSPKAKAHHADTKVKVKDAFRDDNYLLGPPIDKYGNRCNYGSTTIQKVNKDLIYSHDQKLGFIFSDEFKDKTPKRGIALLSSAIECAYMEYKKHGYLKTLRFDPKDFAKRYRRHVRGIERLIKVDFHRKLFARERKRWAKANLKDKVSAVHGAAGAAGEEEDGPPVHLHLGYYLPPGAELSESEGEM